jgi:hypothetical protein
MPLYSSTNKVYVWRTQQSGMLGWRCLGGESTESNGKVGKDKFPEGNTLNRAKTSLTTNQSRP